MLIYFFISYIIIVPLTHGNTDIGKERKADPKAPVLYKVHDEHNKTKMAMASEGGTVMSNTPSLSLPEENQAIPITSSNGISSNKVKARKGAILNVEKDSESENLSEIKPKMSTPNGNQLSENDTLTNEGMNDANVLNNSNPSTSDIHVSKPHKPTIVSAEAIAKADQKNNSPALEDGKERNVKIHKMNSNGHPGMVMPIVITILVVPMFAVLGYMVLKRGQEAWKNRHYKRMDFLLDGMYNE